MRATVIVTRLMSELSSARLIAGVSQARLAQLAGMSQAQVSRYERMVRLQDMSFADLSAIAAVLGYELGANLYPTGDPIRDKGHEALIARFRAVLAAAWRVAAEVPLPGPGNRRAWDLLLRIPTQLVGVEAETRLRDIQAFVRRVRQREADGGADVIVIALAESAVNRRLLAQLLEALGQNYATPPRRIVAALRQGRPLPGSGVVLI